MNVIRAAIVGDVETVKQWLTAPHTRHPRQVAQVLIIAAERGHVNICQVMLDRGHVSHDDITIALQAACRHNQQSTAQLLVRHGHINTYNMTVALLAACVRGHLRIVTWLMSDIMQLSQSDRIKWLLTTACACGDLRVVKQLTTRVDSDETHVMNQALRVACHNGRDDVVKWLMSHTTADVSSLGVTREFDGEVTSLMVACDMGYKDIVSQLMQCVTPHTVNMMSANNASTALHFTICCETVENLRMHIACANSDIATVTATLYSSNVDLQAKYDYTALHYACTHGDVEIVRMLLSAFADTHITDDDRRTSAMLAEMHGFAEVLPYLRYTLPEHSGIFVHISSNNISASISALSVENATLHNISYTSNSKLDIGTGGQIKRSTIRIV